MIPIIKRGDTFAFTAAFEENSAPVTGIAEKLMSQVRDPFDKKIADLQIAETSTPGTYLLKTDEPTADWPEGQIYCDIQYSENDVVTSSETFSINVIKDVTR